MVKPQKTEKQFKANIFNVYSKYREEPSSDRRQVYFGQLCDSVFRWCAGYILSETREMGLEIYNALNRIVDKPLKDEKEFFSYLNKSLENAKNEYYRKDISNIYKLSRETKKIDKFISLEENNAGRMLSEEEKIELISKWFNKTKEKARKYLDMIENKNIVRLSSFKDDNEIDIPDSYNEPENTFLSKINASVIRETVESVLSDKQERTRECCRALFTAYCINKSIDFEEVASVFNAEILEKYLKNSEKPKQYEIYLKYHPEAKKESAEVSASETLKTFLNDLKSALKANI